MKRFGKILRTALMLVLLLNLIPRAYAQEAERLIMTADKTQVSHGETVTVTVQAGSGFETRGAGMTIVYNSKVLQLVSSNPTGPFQVRCPVSVGDDQRVRISFSPGETVYTIQKGATIAVLTFQSIAPAEKTSVEMTAVYPYGTDLEKISMEPAATLELQVDAVEVETIRLDKTELKMEIKDTFQLNALVSPGNASDKTVTWSSSDEGKVKVAEGLLTAVDITEDPVVITAKAGDREAYCSVTVSYPPNVGYVVSLPAERSCLVGEIIEIPVTVANVNMQEIKTFNAFDITLFYDGSCLDLTNVTASPNTELTVEEGEKTVRIVGYGDAQELHQDLGKEAFTLTFTAKKTGSSEVIIQDNARVDHAANAVISNAAKAALAQNTFTTRVNVNKFMVTLKGFQGEPVADPAEPYTFTETKIDDAGENLRPYYDYYFTGNMGLEELQDTQVIRNEDGSFTIEKVTGHLYVEAERIGREYDVIWAEDLSGSSSKAQFEKDYTVNLDRKDGYSYTVDIYIGGEYYCTMSGDTCIIPGKYIRGDITFEVTKTSTGSGSGSELPNYKVSFQGSGVEDVVYHSTSVSHGDSYSFHLNKVPRYIYSVTCKEGNEPAEPLLPKEDYPVDNYYTVTDVQSNLVITVEKEPETSGFSMKMKEYLTLDGGKKLSLVLVEGKLDDTQVYAFSGEPMYYIEAKGTWCVLTTRDGSASTDAVSVQTGRRKILKTAVYDVNMSGQVDINDAQLVYDMYNGKYPDFTKIDMQRFLNADVNGDYKINVKDAADVVDQIE